MYMLRNSCVVLAAVAMTAGCVPQHQQDTDPLSAADYGVRFEALSEGPVVNDRASTGGVSLVDYDGDGDPDLFVTNGYDVSAEEPVAQPNRLYRNDDGTLIPVRTGPPVEEAGFSSGSTWADYDIDGDGLLDIVIGNWPNAPGPAEENLVLMNRSDCGNWLQVKLVGTNSNRAGIGARIEVTYTTGGDGGRQIREVQTHTGWRSQNPLVQHFGLGSDETVDVLVRWPSGIEDRLSIVAANQMLEIVEGSQ